MTALEECSPLLSHKMMESIETQIERSSPAVIYSESVETKNEKYGKEERTDVGISENRLYPEKKESIHCHRSPSLLRKRSQLNPLVKLSDPNHPYRVNSFQTVQVSSADKDRVSTFTRRVMSAKLLRVKQLQNQLKEAEMQINELIDENRVLRTLKKRQDNALRKYEGDQAQLPQLIRSHGEETRVLTIKLKQAKQQQKDLEQKLRRRDEELATLRDQHNQLVRLSQDKHLGSREKLTKQVERLQLTVDEQNERIQLLTRRVELEAKNHKHRMATEVTKHRHTQAELTMALETIENLKSLVEAKEKYINSCGPKLSRAQTSTTENGEIRFRNVLKPSQFVNKLSSSRLGINTVRLENRNLDSDDASQASTNSAYDRSSRQIVQSGADFRKKMASWKLRSRRLPAVSTRDDDVNGTSDDNTRKFDSSESESAATKRISSRRMSLDSGATTNRNSENGSMNDPLEKSPDEMEKRYLNATDEQQNSNKEILKDSESEPESYRLKGFLKKDTKDIQKPVEEEPDTSYCKTSSLSIGKELKRFEDKLLSSEVYTLSVGMTFEDHADRVVRRLTKEPASDIGSDNEFDFDECENVEENDEVCQKFDSTSFEDQKEEDNDKKKPEDIFLEESVGGKSTVKEDALDENTKTRLLKALKDIDAEDRHGGLAVEWTNGSIDRLLPVVGPARGLLKSADGGLHGASETNIDSKS